MVDLKQEIRAYEMEEYLRGFLSPNPDVKQGNISFFKI